VPVLSLNFAGRKSKSAAFLIAFLQLQFHERLMTEQPKSPVAGLSRRTPDWLLPLGLYLLLSLLIVLPFFCYGTASGHDFEFHAASWFDAAYQWKQGLLYPRWTSWTNHGFGEPRFVFYPPLSWMLGAALTLLLPDAAVPVVFLVLMQTFAGLFAYFLLRPMASRRAASLGAACYMFNPNALLVTYIRSDFAEQLACVFFPLLLLAALRLGHLLPDPSHGSKSRIVLFAIPFACVWLSNAPAGVLASYAMTLLFICAAISARSFYPLLQGAAGLSLGLGLTSFYLLPAAYEQRWVHIGQALASGLLPYQNFLFTEINDPEHTWFNSIASLCALSLILLLCLSALASRRLRAGCFERDGGLALALLLVGAAATLLTLRFSLPFWTYLPKLRFVQFPWRWMSIIALVAACFLTFAIERRRGSIWFALLVLLSVPLARFLVQNTWWDGDEMPTMRDALDSGQGFDGTDEYDPEGDDHLDLPPNAPLAKVLSPDSGDSSAPPAGFEILNWSPEHKKIRVNAPSEARIALRLLNYPAWRVTVNGKTVTPERMDDVNQMVVAVRPGTSVVSVDFVRTRDRKLGNAIAAASALMAALLLWLDRKRRALADGA
jgi:6-pyruvoyl-tetrahydropterin synthase related domain